MQAELELPTVLVVDDEIRALETIRRTLDEDYRVLVAESAEQALEILQGEFVQVALCDQRMPGTSGVELLREVREGWPDVVRIMISGYTDPDDVIAAINEAGIYQFVHKPWHPETLLLTVQRAVELFRLQRENQALHMEMRTTTPVLRRRVEQRRAEIRREVIQGDGIVRAHDSPLNDVCQMARKVAAYDIPVLITGESGTGKELLARSIHYHSPRADKPFVVENCAALTEELLQSELFGHKRGAFTGAHQERIGLFQQADGGTLFLDEIGETSPTFQVKLLRVLQEGEVRPVGGTQPVPVDVRIISATNRDLQKEVRAGGFREDLFYRLNALMLHTPALRERPMDIPLLAEALVREISEALEKPVQGLTPDTVACLQCYHWPGNVRQLQNEILRMVALSNDDQLTADLLSPWVVRGGEESEAPELEQLAQMDGSLKTRIEQLEAAIIREVLIRHRWNKTRAAHELGLSRVGLRGKLQRYGIATGE